MGEQHNVQAVCWSHPGCSTTALGCPSRTPGARQRCGSGEERGRERETLAVAWTESTHTGAWMVQATKAGTCTPPAVGSTAAPQGLPSEGEQWASSTMCKQSAGHALAVPPLPWGAQAAHRMDGGLWRCGGGEERGRERETLAVAWVERTLTAAAAAQPHSPVDAWLWRQEAGRPGWRCRPQRHGLALPLQSGRHGPPRHGPALPLQSERCSGATRPASKGRAMDE